MSGTWELSANGISFETEGLIVLEQSLRQRAPVTAQIRWTGKGRAGHAG